MGKQLGRIADVSDIHAQAQVCTQSSVTVVLTHLTPKNICIKIPTSSLEGLCSNANKTDADSNN